MPPNVNTAALRTLHRIHRQVSDLKGRQQRGPKQICAAEAHVKHQEDQCADLEEQLKKMRMAADGKQLQLKVGEDKIKDLQGKLNTAASNREYQALKDQIAAIEVTNSVLDDEILEVWEKIEQFEGKISQAKDIVQGAKEKLETITADVQQHEPLIQGDLTRLEAELQQSEGALPAELKEKYHRVLRHLGEDALAPIENQFCGGCNQKVPINIVAELKIGHPMFCKSCGRLLYMSEGE